MSGNLHNPRVATGKLVALGNQKRWVEAIQLLYTLAGETVKIDEIHLSASIRACARAFVWQSAVALLYNSAAFAVQQDLKMFGVVLNACDRGKQWEVSACERLGRWRYALMLMEEMDNHQVELDTITFCNAICACAKGQAWIKVLDLWDLMADRSVGQNTILCSATINACAKGSWWTMALEVLSSMPKSQVEQNTITYNAAISACNWFCICFPCSYWIPPKTLQRRSGERGSQWPAALELLFSEMPMVSVEQNIITFSAAISACEKAGEWRSALNILWEMKGRKLSADTIACSAAISACEKAAQWEVALQLLCNMQPAKLYASGITYSATISACEKAHQWQAACDVLAAFLDSNLPLESVPFSAAIAACSRGQWEVAIVLLEEMSRRAVALLNGYAYELRSLLPSSSVRVLRMAAQRAFGQKHLRIITGEKRVLVNFEQTLEEAQIKDGECLTVLVLQPQLAATEKAFALWCHGDNTLVTWGGAEFGGDSSAVQYQLRGVQQIQATERAFAAIVADGSVVTWGDQTFGGDSSAVQYQLRGVQHIQATRWAFAAVLADGSVVTWGHGNQDKIVCTAAITSCGNGSAWALALSLLDEMPRQLAMPDVSSFSIALSGCQLAGQWQEALLLLEQMRCLDFPIDGIHWGSVVGAAAMHGRDFGARWLRSLRDEMMGDGTSTGVLPVEVGEMIQGCRVISSSFGLVVVDKPAGLVTEEAQMAVQQYIKSPTTIISRLDRPTSGVLPIVLGHRLAKTTLWFQAQFAGRLVEKEYLCLCHAKEVEAMEDEGSRKEIRSPLRVVSDGSLSSKSFVDHENGREAVTFYEVLGRYRAPEELVLIKAEPKTGRSWDFVFIYAWYCTGTAEPDADGGDETDAENRVVEAPWYTLTVEEILPDSAWWVKAQTKLQQLKAEQDSFYQVLRRSATILANRQLLTLDVKENLSALYNESMAEVTEAVAWLRSFGRARSLGGSESPIFCRLHGLQVPKKTTTPILQSLEGSRIAVPAGEDFALGTTSGALQASQGAKRNYPMPGQGLDPVDSSLHFCLVSGTLGRDEVGRTLCDLPLAARSAGCYEGALRRFLNASGCQEPTNRSFHEWPAFASANSSGYVLYGSESFQLARQWTALNLV
eukprot:symbB.v1.2.022682.t1/scaffold2025.1/size93651/5